MRDVLTTAGSATAFSSAETITVTGSSTSLLDEASSFNVTESVGSTETSWGSEAVSPTALSTTEGLTTEMATTTALTLTFDYTLHQQCWIRRSRFIYRAMLHTGGNTAFVVSDVTHDGPSPAL
ncbi:uncharacterized protein FMAN_03458 [Fusarium mangiferae]|uniref:Uncharacterized protein n=1 Tax=Fusarium mangiferae TaxID=192010 RepID=A0A1L7TG76_FUSMA|nr:uncharacterized protein FMAN_03458 [Fusarium mangiferae]CVK94297.1 uncharacterized protein FMAN_03458 [Fusarium mangiferae]